MSEATDATGGGHEILNPFGARIRITQRTIRALDMRHYLQRDHDSGLLQIKPGLAKAFLEIESEGMQTRLYDEIGKDFAGPNVCICGCRVCSSKISDLDYTRLSSEHQRQQADSAVAEVRAKRTAA